MKYNIEKARELLEQLNAKTDRQITSKKIRTVLMQEVLKTTRKQIRLKN